MIKCYLSRTLVFYVNNAIEKDGTAKQLGLSFFSLGLTNKSGFTNIKKALAGIKGEDYISNVDDRSVFLFFKPANRHDVKASEMPKLIEKVFSSVGEFGIPDNDEIVEFGITENEYKYWCVKLQF